MFSESSMRHVFRVADNHAEVESHLHNTSSKLLFITIDRYHCLMNALHIPMFLFFCASFPWWISKNQLQDLTFSTGPTWARTSRFCELQHVEPCIPLDCLEWEVGKQAASWLSPKTEPEDFWPGLETLCQIDILWYQIVYIHLLHVYRCLRYPSSFWTISSPGESRHTVVFLCVLWAGYVAACVDP